VIRSRRHLFAIRRALVDYWRGPRRRFDLPIDLGGVSPFQRRVLRAARRIPAGRVLSYGDLARRIGQPRACRAVGQALGRNPVPIVIPCHRVVAGAGRLGGYVGGVARKRKLLAIEGAVRLAG
jgi:methylated-DNA-[protein]-cysteine S-methyltransferase